VLESDSELEKARKQFLAEQAAFVKEWESEK
jgi:hypothetical protein